MSDDDEFGFDDDFDDSFLQQVDDIAAKASTTASYPPHVAFQSASKLVRRSPAITRHISAPTYTTKPSTSSRAFSHPAIAGSSRPGPPPPPSSDDYDDFHIPAEALSAIDTMTSRPATTSNSPLRQTTFHRTSSSSTSRPSQPANVAIPSSRLGMGAAPRSSAGFQTHLNFRRENQSTKGKTWDRTAFAESGRRLVVKAKDKAKGYVPRDWVGEDEDDEEEEEEEDFEPLVPGPKPFVDPHKPYDPQKHTLNSESAKTYIYPTNHPKRDYQFEIIQSAFIDNCLVALPTGLGKTFIAGVVMLNFYRWFPTGKIVFLAPTKPLVNQQIEACQMSCGIPSASAAVMTGSSIPAAQRAKLWDAKRVFYCTPQTLDNDLKNGSVDPRDIVLAVFDEAHKASGHYAYTTILAYITAQNPYFRVLALTATPGNDVVKVQAVVDALHISRIEIREAEAPDISKYMNEKRTEKHTVSMTDVIEDFRDRWADLMRPHVKKLVDANILNDRALDIKRLKPFTMTAKRMELARDRSGRNKWALGPLQQLEKMARAMGNLLEFSLGMFHTILSEIAGGLTASGKKSVSKGAGAAMRNNYEFQKLVRDVDAEMNLIRMGMKRRTKADEHPKMVKTLQLLLEHFSLAEEDEREHGVPNDTRAMVFCSYRECVLEIVDMLNEHPGLIKATKFVGQSQGKKEDDKGFKQKEQKQTIAQFKEGIFNVLVSTSIGEEGLDIGEVDFVVIYDMPKQSIKLLQRIGRTGRKRDGKVHVLMSENREDTNWDAAQRNHRDIQEEILHSRNLELFDDVERLLPPGKLPVCEERFMEVDPWDPEEGKTKKKLAGATRAEKSSAGKKGDEAKRQRGHEIPENGHAGFKSVAELLRESGRLPPKAKGRGKGKEQRIQSESEESEGEEPDLDLIFEEMERKSASKRVRVGDGDGRGEADGAWSGEEEPPIPPPKKRKVVKKAGGRVESEEAGGGEEADRPNKGKGKSAAKPKAAAKGGGKGKSKSKPPDDEDVEAVDDVMERSTVKGKAKAKPRVPKAQKAEEERSGEEEETLVDTRAQKQDSAFDFLAVAPVPRRRGETPKSVTLPSSPPAASRKQQPRTPSRSPSSEAELEESPFHFDLPGTRPVPGTVPAAESRGNGEITAERDRLAPSLKAPRDGAKTTRLSPGVAAMAGFSQIGPVDLTWDDDLDLDVNGNLVSSPSPPPSAQMPPEHKSTPVSALNPASTPSVVPRSSGIITDSVPGRRRIMGISRPKHSPAPAPLMSSTSRDAMPPPPLPASHIRSSPSVSPLAATQFPIRRPGKRKVVLPSSDDTQTPERSTAQAGGRGQIVEASPVQVVGRLRRRKDPSPVDHRRKKRSAAGRRAAQRFLDLDAEKSGSEGSSDEPGSENDVETESDRQFAGLEFQPTQAPRGYNQRAAYAAGLSTQMASKSGLHFGGTRHDTSGWLAKARKPVLVSDDEREGRQGSSENEYEMGSFVCDDADLSFDSQDGSDPLDSQR